MSRCAGSFVLTRDRSSLTHSQFVKFLTGPEDVVKQSEGAPDQFGGGEERELLLLRGRERVTVQHFEQAECFCLNNLVVLWFSESAFQSPAFPACVSGTSDA